MIRIGGIDWYVEKVDCKSEELRRSNGTYALGCTNANKLTIFISDRLQGQLEWTVLCHEICHAYCLSYHIAMPIEYEEKMCNFMAKYGKDIIKSTNLICNDLKKIPKKVMNRF